MSGLELDSEILKPKQGQLLYERGQEPDGFYILVKGSIELRRDNQTTIEISQQGHSLGGVELLLNANRLTHARTREKSALKKFPLHRKHYSRWLKDQSQKRIYEIQNMCHLLDWFNRRNEAAFNIYREYRDLFSPFLSPIGEIAFALPDLDIPEPLQTLLKIRNQIVGASGRSDDKSLDQPDVPNEFKSDYKSGDLICEEGDEADTIFILLEGMLGVLKQGQQVGTLEKPGSLFGEMAPMLDRTRTASVKANESSVVATLPDSKLSSFFNSSVESAIKVTEMVMGRLRRAWILNSKLDNFESIIEQLFTEEDKLQTLRARIQELLDRVDDRDVDDEDVETAVQQLKVWLESEVEVPKSLQLGELTRESEKKFTQDIS